RISPESAQNFGDDSFVHSGVNARKIKYKAKTDIHVSLVIDQKSEERERFISFVNSTPTYDGGFHHDRIKRLFINMIKEKLERQAKKDKVSLVDNDILAGITFIIGV